MAVKPLAADQVKAMPRADTLAAIGTAPVVEPATTRGTPLAGAVATGNGAVTGLQILPPVSALIELAVLVLGLLFIEWSFPNLDLVNLQPSPYWIPVLLLSLQYGTPSGSLAAILAIAIYFTFGNFPQQDVGENEFTYRLRILLQPILWIAAAVLLGQFRMVQIATKHQLTQRLATLEEEATVLADYSTRLRERCDVLERTLAGRSVTPGLPLLEALSTLPSAAGVSDGKQHRHALEQCLAAAFPNAASSVFLRKGKQLELVARSGWPADARWQLELDQDHAIYAACIDGQRTLTVLEAGQERVLNHQGIAVVPIIGRQRASSLSPAQVLGILKIERIDARNLTPNLPRAMAALAANIASSLATEDEEHATQGMAQATPHGGAHSALVGATEDARPTTEHTTGLVAIDLIRSRVVR